MNLEDFEDDEEFEPKNERLTDHELEVLSRVEHLEKQVAHLSNLIVGLLEDEDYTLANSEF